MFIIQYHLWKKIQEYGLHEVYGGTRRWHQRWYKLGGGTRGHTTTDGSGSLPASGQWCGPGLRPSRRLLVEVGRLGDRLSNNIDTFDK